MTTKSYPAICYWADDIYVYGCVVTPTEFDPSLFSSLREYISWLKRVDSGVTRSYIEAAERAWASTLSRVKPPEALHQ